MNEYPMDDLPSYNDLTEREKYIIIAYRRLLEDHKLINTQAEEGMLDFFGAASMSTLSLSSFVNVLQRHLVDELKN